MAQQASQAELNRFVKVVDEFKAKYARLIAPATKAQVYASGNQKMIADYETAVVRGNALNRSIAALVGAWAAFKRGYAAVTDTTSMYIGDAIDEIRSWFGYDPAHGIGEYGGPVVSGQKPYDMDKHLYGMSYNPMLNESGVTEQYDDVSRYASLGALAAAPALAAIPAAVAVAGAGGGQGDQAVAFHAEHGDAAAHVFAPSVGPQPAEFVAHHPRELEAVGPWLGCDETADVLEFFARERACAIAHGGAGGAVGHGGALRGHHAAGGCCWRKRHGTTSSRCSGGWPLFRAQASK